MHVRVRLDRHELVDLARCPASHTRPRSLRSRSISITCSARSLDARAARAPAPGRRRIRAARPRARDRPRRRRCRRATLTRRSGDELITAMPSSCATPLNGPGFVSRKPAIDMVRLHAVPQRRPPAARKIRLIDVARADVLERPLDGVQIVAADHPRRLRLDQRLARRRGRRCDHGCRSAAMRGIRSSRFGSATIQQRPLSCS